MAGIAAAIIGAGALGAGASIFGASKQSSAANKAISAQEAMFAEAERQQMPFINAGKEAAGTLSDLLRPGADMGSLLKNIPGFQFLQNITQQGVSNQGTVTGLGGNTLLAGANAGNNIALSGGWVPIVNALQGLVSTGAGAAGSLGGQAIQTGGQVGSNLVGIGNAQAGAATAVGANVGNSLTSAALLTKLLGNQSMYGTGEQGLINSGAQPGVSNGGYNFLDAMAR